jgi:hypothetical protein
VLEQGCIVNNYTLIALFKYKLYNINETIQGGICQLKSIGLIFENVIGLYSKVSSFKNLKLASLLEKNCLKTEIPILSHASLKYNMKTLFLQA